MITLCLSCDCQLKRGAVVWYHNSAVVSRDKPVTMTTMMTIPGHSASWSSRTYSDHFSFSWMLPKDQGSEIISCDYQIHWILISSKMETLRQGTCNHHELSASMTFKRKEKKQQRRVISNSLLAFLCDVSVLFFCNWPNCPSEKLCSLYISQRMLR